MPDFSNEAEARAKGYEIKEVPAADRNIFMERLGVDRPRVCEVEGEICMTGNCVNGKQIIMFCNGSGACTRYTEVDC